MLDAGDALVGSGKLGTKTQGEVIIAGMNLMGYDAMALGPRELALGAAVLGQRMEEAAFPMLSANAVASGTSDLAAQPYVLVDVAGRRVGILGLTSPPPERLAGFQVLDAETAATRYVPELREQGAELVILLTNVEFRAATELASRVRGIDLVIAAQPGQLPNSAVQVPGTGTLAVVAEQPLVRHSGRRVGRLAVMLGPDGVLSEPVWQSVPMGPELADDPEMKALLDRFR